MNLLKFFRKNKKERSTASLAKERLQIIVSHENSRQDGKDIIQQLQKELLEVLQKYVKVDQDLIKVQLERNGDQSVLELNVTLPDAESLIQSSFA